MFQGEGSLTQQTTISKVRSVLFNKNEIVKRPRKSSRVCRLAHIDYEISRGTIINWIEKLNTQLDSNDISWCPKSITFHLFQVVVSSHVSPVFFLVLSKQITPKVGHKSFIFIHSTLKFETRKTKPSHTKFDSSVPVENKPNLRLSRKHSNLIEDVRKKRRKRSQQNIEKNNFMLSC